MKTHRHTSFNTLYHSAHLFGQVTGTRGRINDFVIEDGEIEGQS